MVARTFIAPEFGLLIGASLHDRFPLHPDVSGLMKYLTDTAQTDPQNKAMSLVAERLRCALMRPTLSLSRSFGREWMEARLIRPLSTDSPIFTNRGEVDAATSRAVRAGVETASKSELELADQSIRLRASHILEDWLWRS